MTSVTPEYTIQPHGRHWYRAPILWVFVLSLVIRVLWAVPAHITPISDFHGYDVTAKRLVETHTYRYGDGVRHLAYRPPGYPGFLAAIYAVSGTGAAGWKAAGMVQAVLGALSSALLVLLAGRAISPRAGMVAGLLHALWPTLIVYVPVLAAENLAVFLLLVGLLCLRGVGRGGKSAAVCAALAGLLYGLLVLAKPAALFMLPAWLLLAWWGPRFRTRRVLQLVLCVVGFSVAVVPWLVRNYQLGFGVGTFSTQGGYGLWWGNNPKTLDGGSGAPPRFPNDDDMGEIGFDRFFRDKALDWIWENPRRYAALSAIRAVRMLGTEPDRGAARFFWPSESNDEMVTARYRGSEGDQSIDPALVKRAKAIERQNYALHSWFLAGAAPLILVALLLSVSRWRAYALFVLPYLAYLGGLSLTCFAARYRAFSDPLLFVPLAALLADMFAGTADLTPRPLRKTKWILALAAVAASITSHAAGWDRNWYQLKPMPAPTSATASAEPGHAEQLALGTTPEIAWRRSQRG